jgi:hypothetical protein
MIFIFSSGINEARSINVHAPSGNICSLGLSVILFQRRNNVSSHNKSVNGTFQSGFLAKRTGPQARNQILNHEKSYVGHKALNIYSLHRKL